MKKTFQKWLMAFIASAFLVTFGVSFNIQTRIAKENALLLIGLKIEDAKKQLVINQSNLHKIRSDSDKTALTKARSFAWMIHLSPSILTNQNALQTTVQKLGADELIVVDDKGIITASSKIEYLNFDMASSQQSAEFLKILKDPTLEIAQDPQPKGFDGVMMQYAGVTRLDAPGLVQIAYHAKRLQEAMEIATIEKLAPGFRIGKNGNILIIQDGLIKSIADEKWLNKSIEEYGISPTQLKTISDKNGFLTEISGTMTLCAFEKFNGYTILGTLPQDEMYLSRNSNAAQIVLFDLVLFGLIFTLISILVQRLVIDGIYSVNHSLSKITKGDLHEKVHVETTQEFRSLSTGINAMVAALKQAIADAAARLDAELEFARAIQLSSLPKVNAILDIAEHQKNNGFDLHAVMFTAKEVGGDFYDFFFIDDRYLVVIVADVSGKGIPAALFMMTLKPLIRGYAEANLSAAEVFTKTNSRLCESSDSKMFVTAFMGILDTQTGKFTYVNAGHNPPLIRRKETGFVFIKPRPGLVLAAIETIEYKQVELQMFPNDMLFLYTDGVTEALNPALELFSEERLLRALNRIPSDASPAEVLIHVKAAVDEFSQNTPQADDITMLGLEYKGPAT